MSALGLNKDVLVNNVPDKEGKEGDTTTTVGQKLDGSDKKTYWVHRGGSWTRIPLKEYIQINPNAINYKPLDDLGFRGANAAANYRYPDDIAVGSGADYVMFEFFRYAPPYKGINKGATKDGSSALQTYNQSAQDAKLYEQTEGMPVILYMPEDISTGYKANWTGKAFSNIGRDALAMAGSDDFNEGMQNAMTAAGTAFNMAIPNAGNKVIRDTLSKITGESLSQNDVFGATRGVILNPNVELLFNGTDLRNFSLNYKLVPRNTTEAGKIKNIINAFRRNMLPTFAKSGDITFSEGTNVANNFIRTPNVCKVTFMRGGIRNPDVPQYKMCAITNVEINYTPDGTYATYGDGTMVAYGLALSFQETKLIFASEVEKY